jgi:hypothetical protein
LTTTAVTGREGVVGGRSVPSGSLFSASVLTKTVHAHVSTKLTQPEYGRATR